MSKKQEEKLKVIEVNPPTKEHAKEIIEKIKQTLQLLYQ